MPAGTGQVVVRTSTSSPGPLDVTLVRAGRVVAQGRRTAPYDSGDTYVRLATPLRGASRSVVCVRNGGPKPLGLAGTPANTSPKVKLNGKPVDALIRLEYRGADRVTWWSRIGAVARRFADGKASWVGSWTMWLALGLSLVAIVLGVVLLWRGPRRAALLCALVAVLNAGTWSLLVPPFQVPDEESHTGYVQYLAETGKVPKPGFIGYSAEENGLLSVLDFGGVIGVKDNPPPQGPAFEARLRAVERSHPSRVGGGDPAGTVVYPPVFAGFEAVPYLLSPTGDSLLDRLVWMRVLCVLFAGATVYLTYRFLRELLPATPWAWTTGALALAFFPMFDFISGGVQNDDGLYVCAAGLFWAMTRVLREGLTVRCAASRSAGRWCSAILMKYTMIGLVPAAAATDRGRPVARPPCRPAAAVGRGGGSGGDGGDSAGRLRGPLALGVGPAADRSAARVAPGGRETPSRRRSPASSPTLAAVAPAPAVHGRQVPGASRRCGTPGTAARSAGSGGWTTASRSGWRSCCCPCSWRWWRWRCARWCACARGSATWRSARWRCSA